jgi:hypothetical protein
MTAMSTPESAVNSRAPECERATPFILVPSGSRDSPVRRTIILDTLRETTEILRRVFRSCIPLGEPNSKHVNKLYPVVDGFPARIATTK